MGVTFGTPVTGTGSGSASLVLSGVTSGQPIMLAVASSGTPAISDTFSTPYTWTRIQLEGALSAYVGTGGAGTSGTITVTGSSTVTGIAAPCIGASTASGLSAIDHSGGTAGLSATATSPSLTPSVTGEGAFYACAFPSTTTVTVPPGSPWTNTSVTGMEASTYVSPPASSLTASWGLSTSSTWDTVAAIVKHADPPQPPTAVSAVAGTGQATVSFTPPTNNGGLPVTGYTVTASPGGQTATGSASPIAVTGLTNGTSYTFTVVATNAVGNSTQSAPSSPVTPSTVPGAPTLSGGGGNTVANLTWQPPTNNGGATVTGYNVYQGTAPGGESSTPVNASPLITTDYIVSGLTNGTTYYFTVKAINANGAGPASNEVAATPVAPLQSVSAPTLTAVEQADPLSGDPEILLTVTNTQPPVGTWPDPTLIILRSDGNYVIGASPTDPLAIQQATSPMGVGMIVVGTLVGGGTLGQATIVDRTAPYGVISTYVAYTVYGGTTSTPSAGASVLMGQAPDTVDLWTRTGWAADEDASGQWMAWLSGIGQMLQRVDNLCRDGYDTNGNRASGWSQLLDIERCPTEALPWLGQLLGVRFTQALRDDQQRYLIENAPGFARGTPAAIIAAVNAYLLPGFTCTIIERDTSAYHLSIDVPTVGTIGPSACISIYLENPTCSSLMTAFATCADLWNTDAQIAQAVTNALPAGLVAAINFV